VATGGSSGGPWYAPFDPADGDASIAVSLDSYGYSGQENVYGPKFDANTQAVFDETVSTTSTGGGLVVVGG
jgi:hypothetical protein